MIEINQTSNFSDWLKSLRDRQAKSRVEIQIRRMSLGNFGDVKPTQSGVSEIRINYGPGYRLYFKKTGKSIVLLLMGGNKANQQKDIKLAVKLAENL